jgi:hypothetical protein
MSFLKKILGRVYKNSGQGFNLKNQMMKKAVVAEETGYLPDTLTPLEDFDETGQMQPKQVDPSYSVAMERYIDQNVNESQLPPIPSEWVDDINLRMHFQNIAQQRIGNMSESFVSRAFQATMMAKEAPVSPQQQAPQQQSPQQQGDDYVDIDTDLVTKFLDTPHALSVLDSISTSILQSGYSQVNNKDTADARAWQSVAFALGPPIAKKRGEGIRRDQRFNYFLFNPDKMPVDISRDYQQFLVANPEIKTDQAIEYLKSNFGDKLITALNEDINNNDPSIKQWILKQEGHVAKDETDEQIGVSLTGGGDDADAYNLQEEDIGSMNLNRVEQREKDVREISDEKNSLTRSVKAFAKLYIQDVVRDMKEVLSKAVESSYNKYPGKESYNIERMNLFNKKLLDQYLEIFNSDPVIDPKTGAVSFRKYQQDPKNPNKQIYTARIDIPQEDIISIFKGNIEKDVTDLYRDIKDQRKEGKADFDILNWFKKSQDKGILPHTALQDSYKKAYIIKSIIRNALKKNTIDGIASNPEHIFTGSKEMGSEEMLKMLYQLSNSDEQGISKEERKRRVARYIDMTEKDAQNPKGGNYEMYKTFADMKRQNLEPGSEESKEMANSMKPYAQYDSMYLMEGLNDAKQNQSDPYHSDVFKAFLGALNPHKRVRTGKLSNIYNSLMGKGEEYKEDVSMLSKKEAIQYRNLKLSKMRYESTLQDKEKAIETQHVKIKKVTDKYHARISKALISANKKRKIQGLRDMSMGEYVGKPEWDGKSPLHYEDYIRAGINKAKDSLWGKDEATHWRDFGPMRQIETIKNREPQPTYNEAGDRIEPPIRSQNVQFIKNKIQEANLALDEFRKTHKITDIQDRMAEALCKTYLVKIASIKETVSRYSNMKIAFNVSIFNNMVQDIHNNFELEFNKIFGI